MQLKDLPNKIKSLDTAGLGMAPSAVFDDAMHGTEVSIPGELFYRLVSVAGLYERDLEESTAQARNQYIEYALHHVNTVLDAVLANRPLDEAGILVALSRNSYDIYSLDYESGPAEEDYPQQSPIGKVRQLAPQTARFRRCAESLHAMLHTGSAEMNNEISIAVMDMLVSKLFKPGLAVPRVWNEDANWSPSEINDAIKQIGDELDRLKQLDGWWESRLGRKFFHIKEENTSKPVIDSMPDQILINLTATTEKEIEYAKLAEFWYYRFWEVMASVDAKVQRRSIYENHAWMEQYLFGVHRRIQWLVECGRIMHNIPVERANGDASPSPEDLTGKKENEDGSR